MPAGQGPPQAACPGLDRPAHNQSARAHGVQVCDRRHARSTRAAVRRATRFLAHLRATPAGICPRQGRAASARSRRLKILDGGWGHAGTLARARKRPPRARSAWKSSAAQSRWCLGAAARSAWGIGYDSGAMVVWRTAARPARTKKARAARCTTLAGVFRRIVTYRSDRDPLAYSFRHQRHLRHQRHRCPANPPARSHRQVADCSAECRPGK